MAPALEQLQRDAFRYFLDAASPHNGLIADNSRPDAHASIAATGFGLAAFAIGVERGLLARAEAIERTLTALRFFRDAPQGEAPDVTGHRGFFYHFLDLQRGRRAWSCELSMIDTGFLIAGALLAAACLDGPDPGAAEVRTLAAALYERIDWQWAASGAGGALSHGWKPECGFLNYGWEGYSEALLLYVLALGSPTHPLPATSYRAWTRTYQWESLYGHEHLYAAPLFIHQFSHAWLDLRGIRDDFMRRRGCDYFENSRRATQVQRQYAIRNPARFAGYAADCWGITACAGPGPATRLHEGVERPILGYAARGIPFGPDDGTLSPWAAAASLPFAPEIVLPALAHVHDRHPEALRDGMLSSFNPTCGWVCPDHYGIEQGPVVLMIENYLSGSPWRRMRTSAPIAAGLRRAGFRGGWLEGGR